MKRKRALLLVSVEIDPVEGGMDNDRVADDVTVILTRMIPHYNPVVVRLDNAHTLDSLEVLR